MTTLFTVLGDGMTIATHLGSLKEDVGDATVKIEAAFALLQDMVKNPHDISVDIPNAIADGQAALDDIKKLIGLLA